MRAYRLLLTEIIDLGNMQIATCSKLPLGTVHARALALSIYSNSMYKSAITLSSWTYIHSVCASRSYPRSSSIQYAILGQHALILDQDPFSCGLCSHPQSIHLICVLLAITLSSRIEAHSVYDLRSHSGLVCSVCVMHSHPRLLPDQSALFKLSIFSSWTETHSVCVMRFHPGLVHPV